jgi:GTP-binding protein
MDGVRKGVLVSMAVGKATTFGIGELQDRGTFFIDSGAEVYAGMIVGENSRDSDMDINPAKVH